MIYDSLMAGWSRGFTLLVWPPVEREARGQARAEQTADRDATPQDDLVSALRFPLSPSWILQRARRPLPSVLPPVASPQPRGCG